MDKVCTSLKISFLMLITNLMQRSVLILFSSKFLQWYLFLESLLILSLLLCYLYSSASRNVFPVIWGYETGWTLGPLYLPLRLRPFELECIEKGGVDILGAFGEHREWTLIVNVSSEHLKKILKWAQGVEPRWHAVLLALIWASVWIKKKLKRLNSVKTTSKKWPFNCLISLIVLWVRVSRTVQAFDCDPALFQTIDECVTRLIETLLAT